MITTNKNRINPLILIKIILISILIYPTTITSNNIDAKLQYYKSEVEKNDIPFRDKSAYYDTIINFLYHKKEQNQYIEYKIKQARLFADNGEYSKAFNLYKNAYESIENTNKKEIKKMECMLQMAKMAHNMGMFEQSTTYLFDLLKYNDNYNINYASDAYSSLGYLFMNLHKMDLAKKYHNKALGFITNNDSISKYNIALIYNNFAGYYFINKKFDSALYYLSKVKQYLNDISDKQKVILFYNNIAMTYLALKEYNIAKNYFLEALKIDSGYTYSYARSLVLENLGALYTETNETSKSEQCFNEGLEISQKIGAKMRTAQMQIYLSKILFSKKDYRNAFIYMERGQKLMDSVLSTRNIDYIMILKNDFEASKTNMEKEILTQTLLVSQLSNQKKNILLTIFISLFIIITIVTFIVINKLNKQNKTNTILNQTISDLHIKNEADIELSKHYMEDELEKKNRELTSKALSVLKTREILYEMNEEINKLISTENINEKNGIAKHIQKSLSGYDPEKGWEEFKLYFEQIHSSFYKNLDKNFPDLTYNEQRMCALLILNLSAKEIAIITNKSVRSIETLIYRLRKKLNIPNDIKTINFLKELL